MKGVYYERRIDKCISGNEGRLFNTLFHECRLKDRHGNIWDVRTVEFNEKWTILRLGLDGTENYTAVMISVDGKTNELQEYELIRK